MGESCQFNELTGAHCSSFSLTGKWMFDMVMQKRRSPMSKRSAADFKFLDKHLKGNKMLTSRNARFYFEETGEVTRWGYHDAMERVIPTLQTIVENSKSFEEIQANLNDFIAVQKDFLLYSSDAGEKLEQLRKQGL